MVSIGMMTHSTAFSPPHIHSHKGFRSSESALRMSADIPSERPKWPRPPPEDFFTMTGDLLSLSIYGFTDHFLCQDIAHFMVQQASVSDENLIKTAAQSQLTLTTPVWSEDTMHLHSVWQSALDDRLVSHYSPLLQSTGTATVLLCASWLLAGYLHQAFSMKNTLDCGTDRALWVTGMTWTTTCGIMMLMLVTSHYICGCPVCVFPKGDVAYIFDSLSVLTIWRFLMSSLLGRGE